MSEPEMWTQAPVTNKYRQVIRPGIIVALSDNCLCVDNALEPDRFKWLMKHLRRSSQPHQVIRMPIERRVGTGIQVFLSTLGIEPKVSGSVIRLDSIASVSFCNDCLSIQYLATEQKTKCVDVMFVEPRNAIEIFERLRRRIGSDGEALIDRKAWRSLFGSESQMTVTRQTTLVPPPSPPLREPSPSHQEVMADLAKLECHVVEPRSSTIAAMETAGDEVGNSETTSELMERARHDAAIEAAANKEPFRKPWWPP